MFFDAAPHADISIIASLASFLVLLELVTFHGTADILRPERLRERIFGKIWLRISRNSLSLRVQLQSSCSS